MTKVSVDLWVFRIFSVVLMLFIGFVYLDGKSDSIEDNIMMRKQWVIMEQIADMQLRILHHVDAHSLDNKEHPFCPECLGDKLSGKSIEELRKYYFKHRNEIKRHLKREERKSYKKSMEKFKDTKEL